MLKADTCKQSEDDNKNQSRYWSEDEHRKFVEGVEKFGAKEAKKIAEYVGTRDITQVRSHAQKYFLKLKRGNKCGVSLV